MQYILEGTWSGYTSDQSHIVHREILTSKSAAKKWEGINQIRFTDGTFLFINVRLVKSREKVVQVPGYSLLMSQVLISGLKGTVDIEKLPK